MLAVELQEKRAMSIQSRCLNCVEMLGITNYS